jgi:hypothetical protein
VAAIVSAHGAAVGCGSSAPPALGDQYARTRGYVDAATGFDFDSPPPELTCNLGPEAGVCACVDEPLYPNAPNLYFVLDRSGSMSEPWGTGGTKWQVVVDAIWKLVVALGPRANIGAAVFPNPNSSDCAPGVEALASRPGDAPAGRPGATANALLNVLRGVPPRGGTPTAATLQAPWLMPRLQSLSAPGNKTYVILATDGGPNCNRNATCGTDPSPMGELACQPNIESVPGCRPGVPPNCCAPGTETTTGGAQSCEDSQPTIDAVTALNAAGFPVYVIGVPGSGPYAALLDQLGIAGAGGPDAGSSGPDAGGGSHYYKADTADQALFVKDISQIAAQLTGGCTVQLDKTPPDPTLVNVFLGGKVLPQLSPDGGWTLDGTTVTIEGASCQSILHGDVLDVRVVAGCPVVLL